MSDNLHDLNTEEQDQDKLEIDVALLQTQMTTANTNITNLSNQTAGSTSSGLKSLIEANDVDIASIKTKTDFLTINEAVDLDNYDTINSDITGIKNNSLASTLKTAVDANTAKVGITTDQANKITANENAIDAIELKTDYLDITGNGLKYSHGNFLTGSAPGDQLLIQHADLNSGNLHPTSCSMRVTSSGDLRLNVPTGRDYEFRINDVLQYNNTQIKNLVDNVSITQSVDLDTIESDVTGIKNNTLASTLKTAVDANTSLSNANQFVITAFGVDIAGIKNNTLASTLKTAVDANTAKNTYPSADATKVGHISVTQAVDLDTMESNISTNNAKVSSQWSNNGSEIHFNNNVGIRNSNPNSDLEIGDGTSNVRVRLNGQNGQAIASEIIFSDGFTTTNPEYFNGASIRFNSSNNRLEFLTDQNDDGTAEPAIFIVRATTPYVTMTDLFATNVSVNDCNLRPHSVYCYGRRVRTATDTDQDVQLSTSDTEIIYNNILSNGITYNTSTGFFSVSVTGIYHVVATLQIDCGTGAESQLQLTLKNGTTNVLKARTHVSRAESNNNTAMQFNMNAPVRLATSINYNFVVKSNNTGTGVIQNDLVTNNSLMIKGLVLENNTTIPTDWGEANT